MKKIYLVESSFYDNNIEAIFSKKEYAYNFLNKANIPRDEIDFFITEFEVDKFKDINAFWKLEFFDEEWLIWEQEKKESYPVLDSFFNIKLFCLITKEIRDMNHDVYLRQMNRLSLLVSSFEQTKELAIKDGVEKIKKWLPKNPDHFNKETNWLNKESYLPRMVF